MNKLYIKRDAMRKSGIMYLLGAVFSGVVFWLLRDQFVKPYGTMVVIAVVALELLIAVYTLLMSMGSETLDQEGITSSNLFGTKSRLWADLQKIEVVWQYGSSKVFGMQKEKTPYIRLLFSNPYKAVRLPYREDIEQHICRFSGKDIGIKKEK